MVTVLQSLLTAFPRENEDLPLDGIHPYINKFLVFIWTTCKKKIPN